MDAALREYALRDVPRYTSYPTAVQFTDGFDKQTWRTWLAGLGDARRLSLYVHIPFCHQLCWYCGCHTSVPNGYDRAESYVKTLTREIETIAGLIGGPAGRVAHLHFGGGSPTYLADRELEAIVETIGGKLGFAGDAEIAIEIDPRTMPEGRAARFADLGFTRASLGVQDFDEQVQRKINRVQPFAEVEACTLALRDAGITGLNFDLIYGLPGQTAESVARSAQLTASLKPDRVAAFGYAHVPWFKKHQQMIRDADLPGVDERYAQAMTMSAELAGAGYIPIGLDHFALASDPLAKAAAAGTLRRNFQGYTVDPADALLGLGASAISAVPQGYVQNARDNGSWSKRISDDGLAVERGLELTADDRMRGEIIERLMCDLEVDAGKIARAHGFDPAVLADAFERLGSLEAVGLATSDSFHLAVPETRRLFLRTVAAVFDVHFVDVGERHAKAV